MILATLIWLLIAAFLTFLVWAIGKLVWLVASIAESMQEIVRRLDQQRPSL
jgi:hypothetical protein